MKVLEHLEGVCNIYQRGKYPLNITVVYTKWEKYSNKHHGKNIEIIIKEKKELFEILYSPSVLKIT